MITFYSNNYCSNPILKHLILLLYRTNLPLHHANLSVLLLTGVPAVAVSGANCASSTVSVFQHLDMLKDLYKIME